MEIEVKNTSESELKIIESWSKNTAPWISAIRGHKIESRILVTNKAILNVLLDLRPLKVLDIGCGEGWLARELGSKEIDVLGIDAIPEFIEAAKNEDKGRYQTLAYEKLSFSTVGEKFDVLVCNFSLFGEESVLSVFRSATQLLKSRGTFVIQTLHPNNSTGEEQAKDGWREGSWIGFSNKFQDPAPWYFRTIDSWKSLFRQHGFETPNIIEPVNPKTGLPASVIFVGNICK